MSSKKYLYQFYLNLYLYTIMYIKIKVYIKHAILYLSSLAIFHNMV